VGHVASLNLEDRFSRIKQQLGIQEEVAFNNSRGFGRRMILPTQREFAILRESCLQKGTFFAQWDCERADIRWALL